MFEEEDIFSADDNGTLSTVVWTKIGVLFVALCLIAFAFIAPKAAQQSEAAPGQPGTVSVYLTWPDGSGADVDLWVKAPGDVPVGYSNKGGRVFNLLRDDLGKLEDDSDNNFEISYSRTIPEGEYVVNAHLFALHGDKAPIRLHLLVTCKAHMDDPATKLIVSDQDILREGDELTLVRFRLGPSCALIPGSMNAIPTPLRSGGK